MGYETAPATEMLATNCACCGKELVDAESVQAGMGPECRKKHALPNTLIDEDRQKANKLVYLIAKDQYGLDVDKAIAELKALGCDKIVKRIQDRVYGKKRVVVTVHEDEEAKENRFDLKSPYDDDFVYRVKKVQGRKWDGDKKVNHFPIEAWARVWDLIADCYAGKMAVFPTGEQLINGAAVTREHAGLPEPNGKQEPEKPVEVKIERHKKWFAIYTPYEQRLVEEMRTVRGRKWSSTMRANIFPAEREDDVMEIVQQYFPTATVNVETKEP
jgi:hypothetical protein